MGENKPLNLSINRPTLLLENYQPWLDLKVPSKVDASLSEVREILKSVSSLLLLLSTLSHTTYLHFVSRFWNWFLRTLCIPGIGKQWYFPAVLHITLHKHDVCFYNVVTFI